MDVSLLFIVHNLLAFTDSVKSPIFFLLQMRHCIFLIITEFDVYSFSADLVLNKHRHNYKISPSCFNLRKHMKHSCLPYVKQNLSLSAFLSLKLRYHIQTHYCSFTPPLLCEEDVWCDASHKERVDICAYSSETYKTSEAVIIHLWNSVDDLTQISKFSFQELSW